ncbi:DEAD/DEAH box helicase family protein [Carnobacteriaceae bacterium zg-C25]|nr:DEAD/DEAH box helicase family protein [Carnobacteriaceae bacterium zg-C25]
MRACCHVATVENKKMPLRTVKCLWDGQLSMQQQEGSHAISHAIDSRQNLLVSAVTGAGKTEMLFESVEKALSSGLRICLATPRIDVLLELVPRFQKAFPNEDIMVLYGNQKETYHFTQFVMATTHQLLKFTHAFQVLIVDEVDSYPFEHNAMLQRRVPMALTDDGVVIYLTATPTPHHEKLMRQNMLNYFELPARYHQHALSVPKCRYIGNYVKHIEKRRMTGWMKLMLNWVKEGKRFLVFCPKIDVMHQLEAWLNELSVTHFESVYAEDALREEKIVQMREGKVQFLLTTTILERGVTFKNIDVIVLGADHRVFSKAALVQIAGRVGRSIEHPTGQVLFWHNGMTKEMKQAVKWINEKNEQAKRRGLIHA